MMNSSSPSSPTFILGVGAQKAGTSWLDAQLRQLPFCNFGFSKEYHVWDVRFSSLCQEFRKSVAREEHPALTLIRLMQNVDGLYEQYFRQMVHDQVWVVGDITPSYACLDAQAFQQIKHKLEAVGFKVKVIFLLRDPVARNWSALRMYRREMQKRYRSLTDQQVIDYFPQFYQNERQYYRTNYPRTLHHLYQAFDPVDIFVGFYENLFHSETLGRLSDHLGFDVTSFDTHQSINVSPPLMLPQDQVQSCQAFYQEVYDHCFEHYPITRHLWSKDQWNSSQAQS